MPRRGGSVGPPQSRKWIRSPGSTTTTKPSGSAVGSGAGTAVGRWLHRRLGYGRHGQAPPGSRAARPPDAARHRPFEELVDARPRRPSRCRSRPRSTRSRSSSRTSRRPTSSRENELEPDDDTLYGLYEGVPRTEWGADWAPVPNRITLFRLPLEADFADPDDLADEVWVTRRPRAGPPPGHRRRPAPRARRGLSGQRRSTERHQGRASASRCTIAEPASAASEHAEGRPAGSRDRSGCAIAARADMVEPDRRVGQPHEHHDLWRERDGRDRVDQRPEGERRRPRCRA